MLDDALINNLTIINKTPELRKETINLFMDVANATKYKYPPINSLSDIYKTDNLELMISNWLARGINNQSFILLDANKIIDHIELEDIEDLPVDRKNYWKVFNQLDQALDINTMIAIKRFAIHPDYWGLDANPADMLFKYAINYIQNQEKTPCWTMLTNLMRAKAFYGKINANRLGAVYSEFSGEELFCYTYTTRVL